MAATFALSACTRPPSTSEPTHPSVERNDFPAAVSRGAPVADAPSRTGPQDPSASAGTPTALVFLGDTGVDNGSQRAVAEAMTTHCRRRHCDLALHLGDIVYPNGIRGPDDPTIESHFEAYYRDLGLPMYLVLGNHDYRGDVDAWITAFSPERRAARKGAMDARIPARYYTFKQGEVRFVALDTNRLDAAQGRWLDGVLQQARRDGERWIVVIGHHPWLSYGHHGHARTGDALFYAQHLCNRVDFFLSGHEHDKQVLEPHCGVHMVVAGAGAMIRPTRQGPRSRFATSTTGFARLDLHGDVAELQLFDRHGASQYRRRYERRVKPLPRAADGLCDDRTDDPDCAEVACTADGTCVEACTSDPDCLPTAPTPCPCDGRPVVCEMRAGAKLCGCDPACAAGVPACQSDGFCDRHCSTDPDCAAAAP